MGLPLNLTVEEWYPHVHAALRDWREPAGADECPLVQWQLVRQKLAVIHDERPSMLRLLLNEALHAQLNALRQHDHESADLLTRRFLDDEGVLAMAESMHLDRDSYLRRQRKAVQTLTGHLISAEAQMRELRARQIEADLYPPTYYQLIGVEDALETLVQMLLKSDSPPVVALVGLGGIGKTSLADAAVRRIIRHFHYEQTVWLRVGGAGVGFEWPGRLDQGPAELTADTLLAWLARRVAPQMPATLPPRQRDAQLRHVLKSMPCLIVIDNLELSGRSADWAAVLPDLAIPSRFLLTSRTRISDQAGIYHLPVRELSFDHAGELIRLYAERTGQATLASAEEAEVRQIYEVVGGNPLAIKLVVSLASVRPLVDIMTDLRRAYSPKTESLYQGIYWQSWRSLSRPAQNLLEIMPMAGDGGMAPAQMQRLSGLEDAEFWPAVDELTQRSLLEVLTTSNERHARRYAIHRLTESFLHTSVSGWSQRSL